MPGGARGEEAPAADSAVGDRIKTVLLKVLLLCLLTRCCCSEKQSQGNEPPSAPVHAAHQQLLIPRLYPSLSEHALRVLGLTESRYKSKYSPAEHLVDNKVDILKDVPSTSQPKEHTGVGEIITSDIIEGRPASDRVNSELDNSASVRVNSDLGNSVRINQLNKENIESTIKVSGHNHLEHAKSGNIRNDNVKTKTVGASESLELDNSPVNSELKYNQVNGENHNKQEAEESETSNTLSANGGNGLPVVVVSDGPNDKIGNQTDNNEELDNTRRPINEKKANEEPTFNPEAGEVILSNSEGDQQPKLRAPLVHEAAAAAPSTKSTQSTTTTTTTTDTQQQQQQHKSADTTNAAQTQEHIDAGNLESPESSQHQKLHDHKHETLQRDEIGKTNDNDGPQGKRDRNEDQEETKAEKKEKDKDKNIKVETKRVVSDILQKHNEKNKAKKEDNKEMFENFDNGEMVINLKTSNDEDILKKTNVDDNQKDISEENMNKNGNKNNDKNDQSREALPENKDLENRKDQKNDKDVNVINVNIINVNIITDNKIEGNIPTVDLVTDKKEKGEPVSTQENDKVTESRIPKEKDLETNENHIASEDNKGKVESEKDINVEKNNTEDHRVNLELETSNENSKEKLKREEKDKSRDEKEQDNKDAMKQDHVEKSKEDAEMKHKKIGITENQEKAEEKSTVSEDLSAKTENIPAEMEDRPTKIVDELGKKKEDMVKEDEQVKQGEGHVIHDGGEVKKDEEEVKKDEEEVKKDEEEVKKDGEEVKKDGEEVKKDGEEVKKDGEQVDKDGAQVDKDEGQVDKNEGQVDKEKDKKDEPEVLETYSQFAERLSNAKNEKKADNAQPTNGHGTKGSKVKSKNYASPDCGAKMITANPEAQHASKVIASNRDEYLLNKCNDKTWFVVELCESIHPQRFDVANFELFSNLPKDIVVYGSHRFPTRDWTMLGRFLGLEGNRGIQSFNIDMEGFYKYIKVEVLSHYGSEFYCPISLFRIYGLSEFEVIEDPGEGADDQDQEDTFDPTEEKTEVGKPPSVFPDVLKNMLNNVMDVIKRGYRPALGSGESTDACQSLAPNSAIKSESCIIAEHINYIMQCYSAEYKDLMKLPLIASAVSNTPMCHQLVSVMCATPHVKDSLVYDTACNNSYVCVMLSPKHILAMCFMQDPTLLSNTGHSTTHLGCSDSTTEIGCPDSSPDNVSIKSIPALGPAEGEVKSGEPPPLVVNNNNLINTSTVTRTDDDDNLKNGSSRRNTGTESAATILVLDDPEQPVKKTEEVEQEKKSEIEIKESSEKDATTGTASAQDKKSNKKQVKQHKEEQKEQEVKKANGDKHQGNGLGSVNVAGDIKEAGEVPVPGEPISLTTPTPIEPQIPEPKVPQTPTNKESVMVRLSNKIKVLEANVTISNAYLEELSRRYKTQMENMDTTFKNNAQVAYERDLQHQKDISELKEQLQTLTGIVTELQTERASLANTVVEQHLLLMVLEVLVLTLVFTWCNRRRRVPETNPINSGDSSDRQMTKEQTSRTESNSNWPPLYYKCGHNRRNSLDSVMGEREVRPRRQRRLSEDGLNISGTYSDLLIIEPAIPIMMDSHHTERKKKRKSGSLKRSKSNSNIRRGEKYSPNPRGGSSRVVKDNKAERVSSAGVLFVGDKQVTTSPGDRNQAQLEGNELNNQTINDSSTLETSLDDSKLSQDYIHRSFVDEIDGVIGSVGSTSHGGQGKDTVECCVDCDELSKSRALSLKKSISLNGKEKVKKGKKVKRSKSINKNDNKSNIYDEHNYATTNGNSVSFGYESTLQFGGYCYDSRDITDYQHYTDTAASVAHLNGHNSYDYYSSYYTSPRTDSDNLVTSWVSDSLNYDPLLPSINGQRGYEDLSPNTRLRSDNWEWYAAGSGQQTKELTEDQSGRGAARGGPLGSCSSNDTVSETISTCSSDSSGKHHKGKSQEKKTKSGKKKKSKSHKNPNVVEEEVGEIT